VELSCFLRCVTFSFLRNVIFYDIFGIIKLTDPYLTFFSLLCVFLTIRVVLLVIEWKSPGLIVVSNPFSILVFSFVVMILSSSNLQKLTNELFFLVFILEWNQEVDLKHIWASILNESIFTYYIVALYRINSLTSLSWIYLGSFLNTKSKRSNLTF